MLFEIVLNGLLLGGLYTLMGTGFSLQWGISGIINLSYGGMMVLGAYLSYQFFTVLSVQPIVSAIPAAIILFPHAHLSNRGTPVPQFVVNDPIA